MAVNTSDGLLRGTTDDISEVIIGTVHIMFLVIDIGGQGVKMIASVQDMSRQS